MDDYSRIYNVYLQAIETGGGNSSNPPELARHQTNIIVEIGGRRMRDQRMDINWFRAWLHAYADLAEAGGSEFIWTKARNEYVTMATAAANGDVAAIAMPILPAVVPAAANGDVAAIAMPILPAVVPAAANGDVAAIATPILPAVTKKDEFPDIAIVIAVGVILVVMIMVAK
ncbi:MAG: hypothetical protein JRC93_09130 [Deltaproteobacteria bacterium]|nr:hypothetical protein [Deltaproteobacteria bacterium]